MFEILTVVVFIWLMAKAVGLMFKLTWSIAKVIAGLLMALALPVLIACVLFVGGIALLIPIAMILLAVGIVKSTL